MGRRRCFDLAFGHNEFFWVGLVGRMHIIWSLVYWSCGCSATRALPIFWAIVDTALPCISSMEHLMHRFAVMSSGDSSTELLDIIIKRLRYAPWPSFARLNAKYRPIFSQSSLHHHTPYRSRRWVPSAPVPHETESRRRYSSKSRSHYPHPAHPTSDTKPY